MDEVDALRSWNDGPAKTAILEFVASVRKPGPGNVPAAERVATLDNDGTLWCEKPLYVPADSIMRRWRAMVRADPANGNEQPYKAVVENDRVWLASLLDHVPELIKGVTEAYDGITVEAFDEAVRTFFGTATHPTLGVPYTQVAFRPMLELLELLRANEFSVYICSSGGRDFMRPVSMQMYGVERDHVIGPATTLAYRDGSVYRTSDVEQPIDDGLGKPVHIWMRVGRPPIFAAGNADGDVPMLESARFALLLRHDDAAREFAYDAGAEHAVAEARARGWTVASMAHDFATVFDAADREPAQASAHT